MLPSQERPVLIPEPEQPRRAHRSLPPSLPHLCPAQQIELRGQPGGPGGHSAPTKPASYPEASQWKLSSFLQSRKINKLLKARSPLQAACQRTICYYGKAGLTGEGQLRASNVLAVVSLQQEVQASVAQPKGFGRSWFHESGVHIFKH